MAAISQNGDIMNGTEVILLSADADQYPQLTRLHVDFDYRIIEVDNNGLAAFFLVGNKYQAIDTPATTPLKPSLEELEAFTNDNILKILNDALHEPPKVKYDLDEL